MEFVVTVDPTARILSVIYTSPQLKSLIEPKINIFDLLEKGSVAKFTRFLQVVIQQSQSIGWEIFFEFDQEDHFFVLAGYINNESIFLVGAENKEEVESLTEKFGVSADSKIEATDSNQMLEISSPSRPDQVLFDDIGKLYSEMTALQRELSKKQVELEKSNKLINDYAANLEKMVADKTRELSASEAKFRGIFENSSLGIAIADVNGKIITCNNALIAIIGSSKDQICSFSIPELLFTHESQQFIDLMDAIQQQKIPSEEIEKEFHQADDAQKYLNINIYPLQLEGDQEGFIIYIIEDITRRKLNEQALLQSEKLSAVGKIAASLAHEINNPLQSIMGYIGLASETLEADNPLHEYLNIASLELERIKNIVSELRAVSRKPQIKEKVPASLDEVIKRVLNLTKKKADENQIAIIYHAEENLPLVLMDSEQINQVILNMVINSFDSISGNGEITISTFSSVEDNNVIIRIEDNGSGIDPATINKLFEPFFTTKKEGLGLGLHLSKAIIDAHKGDIKAENRRKGGAVFTISLPAA